jgi:hypothetical protein
MGVFEEVGIDLVGDAGVWIRLAGRPDCPGRRGATTVSLPCQASCGTGATTVPSECQCPMSPCQIEHGTQVTRQAVEQQFGISERTAKRELGELCDWGMIEFDRSEQPGSYRLK